MTRAQQMRGALLCVAIYLASVLIAWPFSEMGFVDDWSYIKTAQVFAQTGHIVFNGWAAPMQGWQTIWGALAIGLCGFSFTAVKLSMVPIAVCTIALFYRAFVLFGVHSRNAIVGTLTLALSPVFLPLSVSFMTDIPGLLPIVGCIVLCKHAADARCYRVTIGWLFAASCCSVVGGTARQTAWLGALVMVPSVGWLLRKREKVLLSTLSMWLISIAIVWLSMNWLHQQPYWISNDLEPFPSVGNLGHWFIILVLFLGLFASLILLVLPVLIPWLAKVRGIRNKTPFVLFLLMLTSLQWLYMRPLPWITHMYFSEFSSQRIAANHTDMDHSVLPLPAAILLLLLVSASTYSFIAFACEKLKKRGQDFWNEDSRKMLYICAPYALAYFSLLVPRAFHRAVVDRYMLALAPVAILCLIKLYQDWVALRLPASTTVLLVIMAVLSIAGTHDWFAWQRARLSAIAELQTAGIPRTSFYGGLEYDGWTQIEDGGYVNNPFLTNPPGAYKPQLPVVKDDPCGYDFAPYVPLIHARYTIVFPPEPCFKPTNFPPVTYTSWIPPFRRTIYVQRIRSKTEGRSR